jgi:hypothetical protein
LEIADGLAALWEQGQAAMKQVVVLVGSLFSLDLQDNRKLG